MRSHELWTMSVIQSRRIQHSPTQKNDVSLRTTADIPDTPLQLKIGYLTIHISHSGLYLPQTVGNVKICNDW